MVESNAEHYDRTSGLDIDEYAYSLYIHSLTISNGFYKLPRNHLP
jgi:hypothetical protein